MVVDVAVAILNVNVTECNQLRDGRIQKHRTIALSPLKSQQGSY